MRKKPFNFLKSLSIKINKFYKKESKKGIIINNKSKNKKNFNPVTNFDKSFEKLIRNSISKSFPLDSIMGEEFRDKSLSNSYKWSIDPIDGTKAFIKGLPSWSNLVGLMLNGKSIVGLANFPELSRFYLSDNKNSYLFMNKKKQKIKSSNKNNLKTAKIVCSFQGNIKKLKKNNLIKKLEKSLILLKYDALSYCSLAEGKIDVVIETNLKPYDVIPLIPIIKNAGGCISGWRAEPAEKGGNIVASSNRKLHKKILRLIKSITKK